MSDYGEAGESNNNAKLVIVFDGEQEEEPLDDGKKSTHSQTVERSGKSMKILLLLCLPFAFLSYTIFLPNFLYRAPPHQCVGPQPDNSTFSNSSERSWHLTFSSDSQCRRPATATINGSFTKECKDGWIYDLSLGLTLVTEFDLVCDDAWKRPTLQCVFMIGIMFGSFFGGSLSDRFGRRVVLWSSFLFGGLAHLVLSFANSYFFFISVLFVVGFIHILTYNTMFVMAQESVPENRRATAALGVNLAFGLGTLLVPVAGYFLRDWRWLIRAVSIGTLAYVPLLIIFLKESPLWLEQRRKYSVVETTENKKLRKKLSEDDPDLFATTEPLRTSVFCSNTVMRNRILMSCFLWNVTFLSFYTLTLNSANLGGNIYLNCVFGGLVDIGSYICMSLLLHKTGRRNSLSLCIFISGAFCLLTPPLRNLNEIVGIASSMVGRFCVTTSMSIVILYTGEMFPTLLRNTSVGIASMSARVGSALSPYLIFSGEMIDLAIPFYVMGALAIAAAALTLILPETSETALPDTLGDAIALNKYRLSIIRRRKSWFAKQ